MAGKDKELGPLGPTPGLQDKISGLIKQCEEFATGEQEIERLKKSSSAFCKNSG